MKAKQTLHSPGFLLVAMFPDSGGEVTKVVYTGGGQRTTLAVGLLACHLVRLNLIASAHCVCQVDWPVSFWGSSDLPPPLPYRSTEVTDAHRHTSFL